jgi:hypothetical protein
MKASIIKKAKLENLPSASGVEIVDGVIYIVGDDSPYLYRLDHSLKLLDTIELFKSEDFSSGRIPKKIKPDLECITLIEINSNKYLFILGSGSKENRDKGFLVKLPNKYNNKHFVQEVSLASLYHLLSSNPEVTGGAKLNLEAAASTHSMMILFNRAAKYGKNTALVFDMEEFKVYLTENPELVPFPSIYPYSLPSIKYVPAGFSGASVIENKLFFTAAVEDTDDPVADGEVLGSMIGYIEFTEPDFIRGGNKKILSPLKDIVTVKEGDKIYKGKIESISLFEKDSETKFIALAITDDDMGGSELLMLEIEI